MKNCILHILCEGQTEERFVQKVLAPYLRMFCIYPKPTVLKTSVKKNVSGGLISYHQAINDLTRIFKTIKTGSSETNIVTTMFDFYALPNDFIGYKEAMRLRGPRNQVAHLEQALGDEIARNNFIPYIQLHEFEALLFSDISKLEIDYPNASKKIGLLKMDIDDIGDPELINSRPETAPSKRIIKTLEAARYHYDKVGSGTRVSLAITLDVIMERCVHFRDWTERIVILSDNI